MRVRQRIEIGRGAGLALLSVGMSNPFLAFSSSNAREPYAASSFAALAARYPNLRIACVSNRTYAGQSDIPLGRERFAYATGFAIERLIAAPIDPMAGHGIDPILGDLDDPEGIAPRLA